MTSMEEKDSRLLIVLFPNLNLSIQSRHHLFSIGRAIYSLLSCDFRLSSFLSMRPHRLFPLLPICITTFSINLDLSPSLHLARCCNYHAYTRSL